MMTCRESIPILTGVTIGLTMVTAPRRMKWKDGKRIKLKGKE
jgi:hypothetical protein